MTLDAVLARRVVAAVGRLRRRVVGVDRPQRLRLVLDVELGDQLLEGVRGDLQHGGRAHGR